MVVVVGGPGEADGGQRESLQADDLYAIITGRRARGGSAVCSVSCPRRLLFAVKGGCFTIRLQTEASPPRRPQLRQGDSLLFTNDDSIAEEQKADSSANLRASHFFLGAALA